MNTMHEMNIDGKAYRTWAKLNQNTRIRVKTGIGYTDWSDEGSMIGQGTVGGALVSQANLDRGMVEMFAGSEEEARYGGVRVIPIMFQDDIMRAADSVPAARAGNVKVAAVMKSKQLSLNPDKTSFVLFGRKKQVEDARKVIASEPIRCGDFITKEKVCDKWLGDMFHQDGLAASVLATVKEREAKIKGACYEVAAIVEDWRAQSMGGFQCALDMFQLAIIPSLLYNASTWVEINSEAEELLENLQLFFVRLVLRVPQGTPKVALRSETGLLSMKLRIWKSKCMLLHFIRSMDSSTLARQVYEEQRRYGWPGLSKDVSTICQELGIEDVNTSSEGKAVLKRALDNACDIKNQNDLKESMRGKTEKLKMEDCNLKDYMKLKSLQVVRDIFRTRTNLVEGFKGNFKNRYKESTTNCEGCDQEVDDQAHAILCPAYDDLREGMDMHCDRDLVEYFRRIMKRRNQE